MNTKIISFIELKNLRKKFSSSKIGLVHGVFDFFHYGHLLHIEKAKSLCDILVVSVTADSFVNKGPGRPLYRENERLKIMSSLNPVDYVILSNHYSSSEIIKNLKPNFYFKGSDYKDFKKDYSKRILKEVNEVRKYGGKLFLTNEKNLSSTKLINNYSSNLDKDLKEYLHQMSKKITHDQIVNIFTKAKKLKVLIVGEMIIDKYIFTTTLGKSPKENLIPVTTNRVETYGGGIIATANHISNFVDSCTLLSVTGDQIDQNKKIKKMIHTRVSKILFLNKNSSVIEKTRFLDVNNDNHKLFQASNVSAIDISASLEKKILSYLKKNIGKYDRVIVHDFGHGFFSKNLIKFFEKNSKKLLVNVQTNSSNIGYNYLTKYSKLDYFSIDEPEARLALQDRRASIKELFFKLSKKIKFKLGCITHGRNGSYLYGNKNIYFAPALIKSKPVDTMGAGDAHFAITCLIFKMTSNLKIIPFLGNVAAAIKIQTIGHRKSIERNEFLNYVKSILNV